MAKKNVPRTPFEELRSLPAEAFKSKVLEEVDSVNVEWCSTGQEAGEVPIGPLGVLSLFTVAVASKPHRDLERRVIGEKRHVKLTEAEQTAKAQSESGKDRVAAKKAETDAIAAEVQAAAKQLLVSGSEKHLITGMLAQRTWGPEANRYKDSWIRELLKRKLPA